MNVPFVPSNEALQQLALQIISGKLRDPVAKNIADTLRRVLTEKESEGIATRGAILEVPKVYVIIAGTVEVFNLI